MRKTKKWWGINYNGSQELGPERVDYNIAKTLNEAKLECLLKRMGNRLFS